MWKRLLFVSALLTFLWGNAQGDKELFDHGTKAYNQGDYDQAITLYQKILEHGEHSAELYYNLGNAYYKLNQIAPSVYYYEKALLLKPNDPEIRNNLTYARNMTLDAIDTLPETGLAKLRNTVTGFLTFDQWGYIAVAAMVLFVLLYIAFSYARYARQKRIAFVASLIALACCVFAIANAYWEYHAFKEDRPAIVFAEEVAIKSEPNNMGQEVFTLHEGAKVEILETFGEWSKIRIADGKTGWLGADTIRALKDF